MPPVRATPTAQVCCAGSGFCSQLVTYSEMKLLCFCVPGDSSECPAPENAPDKTVCLDNGECHNGECVPFCQAILNLQPCACNGTADPRGTAAG